MTVIRKTEIEPLDGTPKKRAFWSIISDYDLQTSLSELVDNALDIWKSEGSAKKLHIALTLDFDQQSILISDDAGGVRREELPNLIQLGGSNNLPDAETIGIFGVGTKRAVVALAERIAIRTRHKSEVSFQIDIDEAWVESDTWELPAYEIPSITEGTTIIELSKLRKPLESGADEQLRTRMGETYGWFLKSGNLEILVNGIAVKSQSFDHWAYPPKHAPQRCTFEISPDNVRKLKIELKAGLVFDRDPDADNYGVYFFCNNRLVCKELRTRDVGYFVTAEAGVPHPDASLCRVIVRMTGPAQLMPWNSTKTGINSVHRAFLQLRSTIIQLVSHFTKLSRAFKNEWEARVFSHKSGAFEEITPTDIIAGKRLILPKLPKVNKAAVEKLKAQNKRLLHDKPWTLGLVEAMAAVKVVSRQKFDTRNRIALILLDSNFEIALKEFIVHREDLFPRTTYTDKKIKELFEKRHLVIKEVEGKFPLSGTLLAKARHYYEMRNKLIHERASATVSDTDVTNYGDTIESILHSLFDIDFS